MSKIHVQKEVRLIIHAAPLCLTIKLKQHLYDCYEELGLELSISDRARIVVEPRGVQVYYDVFHKCRLILSQMSLEQGQLEIVYWTFQKLGLQRRI